jgi:hypothetical protein
MKQLKPIIILIVISTLVACKRSLVSFNESQPTNTESLPKIPERLKGNYFNPKDNSLLTISEILIRKTYDFDKKIHINELDSLDILSGNTIINSKTNEKTLVKREGDSLIYHVHFSDTIFVLNQNNILKKYKGYYFLNTAFDENNWEVKKLKLANGKLTFGSINSIEEINSLEKITETPHDTISPYKFKPTKKQFKKFIKNNGFNDNEIYFRLK